MHTPAMLSTAAAEVLHRNKPALPSSMVDLAGCQWLPVRSGIQRWQTQLHHCMLLTQPVLHGNNNDQWLAGTARCYCRHKHIPLSHAMHVHVYMLPSAFMSMPLISKATASKWHTTVTVEGAFHLVTSKHFQVLPHECLRIWHTLLTVSGNVMCSHVYMYRIWDLNS